MQLGVVDNARTRKLAHAQLDSEFFSYREDLQRFQRNPLARVLAGDPISNVRSEAKRLVAERYFRCAAGRDGRPCQRIKSCDSCYRVHCLVLLSGRCSTRAEFRPIMNAILDPDFLA